MTEAQKLQQIKTEYEEARSFLENRKIRWVDQLKLMNNLNRGDENIASTMLFSYFNRIHSNLYEPKLPVKFMPNQESEMRNVEMQNKLALHDWQEMNMSVIEYDWLWDALFFSRGYLETINFDKRRKLLRPFVINPLMFGYDPYFEEKDDWRYYWKFISRSAAKLQQLIDAKIVKGIKRPSNIVSGSDPQIWNYKVLRDQAKFVDPQGQNSDVPREGNGFYQLLEHYTYFDNEKYVVWCDKDITKILREEKLELNDDIDSPIVDKKGEPMKGKYMSKWPIVVREVFKEPHSSVAISVPDLIEDKHRAENVILNLAYIAAKDETTPIYTYDEDAISDTTMLNQRQIQQHIPRKGGTSGDVITPLKRNPAISAPTLQLLNILKNEAAEAVGTTQVSPVVAKGKKTATSDALMQQVSDLTAALQTKILGNSEKEFWIQYYQRYINNMKDGDQKIISVTNSQFTTFETIQLDSIKTELPPKMIITSAREAEFKEAVERRELAQQFATLQQSMPPQNWGMFLKHIWFPKFQTFDSETLDLIYPKTAEELKAEQENEMLSNGDLPPISENDDHAVHLYIHSRVKNNAEKWAHYLAHEILLAKQNKGATMKVAENQGQPGEEGQSDQKPQVKDVNAQEAATPVKGMMEKVGKESKISSNIKK